MQVNIRGGTHYESSLIPGNTVPVLGTGTWRGQDLVAWYTLAWFDKYVKADPAADARLLTDRWCDDDLTQDVDLNDDGNMYSFYFRSRHDFTLSAGGNAVSATTCGRAARRTPTDPDYDFVAAANTADSGGPAGPDSDGDGVPDLTDSCPSVAGTGPDGCPPAPAELRVPSSWARRRRCQAREPGATAGTLPRLDGATTVEGHGASDCIQGSRGRDQAERRGRKRLHLRRPRARPNQRSRRRAGRRELRTRPRPGPRRPRRHAAPLRAAEAGLVRRERRAGEEGEPDREADDRDDRGDDEEALDGSLSLIARR